MMKTAGLFILDTFLMDFMKKKYAIFFSQFGDIEELRVSRNREGRSRHYGFIKFKDAGVAPIVANTMNGYFLMERRLTCNLVSDPHDSIFKGSYSYLDPVTPKEIAKRKYFAKINRIFSEEEIEKKTKSLLEKENKMRNKIKELGIDYDYPGYAAEIEKKNKIEEEINEEEENKKKKKKRIS